MGPGQGATAGFDFWGFERASEKLLVACDQSQTICRSRARTKRAALSAVIYRLHDTTNSSEGS